MRMKRVLRDHFITVGEELKYSLHESLRSAKSGAGVADADRNPRLVAVQGELNEIRSPCREANRVIGADPRVQVERRSAGTRLLRQPQIKSSKRAAFTRLTQVFVRDWLR